MKDFKLPHAIVLGTIIAVLAFLAWQKVDTAPIIAGVITLLGALGWMIKNQAEQGARQDAIATQVNGNNNKLVDTIKSQQDEFRSFVMEQQRLMAQLTADNAQHMRELADKLAEMVPPSAVPQVIALPSLDSSHPTSGPPALNSIS